MHIRKAKIEDVDKIEELLHDVLKLHHDLRPDLFKDSGSKYNKEELIKLLDDDNYNIFVATIDNIVVGYIFTIIKITSSNNLNKIKTLYIDDLCVNSNYQNQHIGTKLLEKATDFAKEIGCYNITLNVWENNQKAIDFYKNE